MNSSDVQVETEAEYFDPEEPDMSEQQFAASLEVTQKRPYFVVDEAETPETGAAMSNSAPPNQHPTEVKSLVEVAAGSERAANRSVHCETNLGAADSELLLPTSAAEDWRNVVSAKVSSYRARKPHKDRYPSLRLPFEPIARMGNMADERVETFEAGLEPAAKEQAAFPSLSPDSHPRIVLEATARVLEFPRPAVRADELAEPMIDRPRIVEAPELLPPPPAMGGILIEPQLAPGPERQPGFDLPLQSAPLRRRILGGLFDSLVVAMAVALFGYVVVRVNGSVLPLRQASTLAAGLMALFWAAYQYAFLVFSARTPGLWVARLHVSRFDGGPVARRLRRWRVLASLLSLTSLGLGYAWCFLDEGQLSWHDRITRTHLAPN